MNDFLKNSQHTKCHDCKEEADILIPIVVMGKHFDVLCGGCLQTLQNNFMIKAWDLYNYAGRGKNE